MAQTALEMFAESLRLRHKEAYNDMYEDIEAYYKKIEKEQMLAFTEYDRMIGPATEKYFREEFEKWYQEKFGRSNQ